jgi:membrane associated rhomboid family serine protease
VKADWRKARFTLGIAAVMLAAWLLLAMSGLTGEAAARAGFDPMRFTAAMAGEERLLPLPLQPAALSLVHLGLLQFAFNLLALVACGRIVESIVGGGSLLLLYLAGAYAAAAAHFLAWPLDYGLLVGSGGAVAAVIGAYGMLEGRMRLRVAGQGGGGRVARTLWLGAAWIGMQSLLGLTTLTADRPVAIGWAACLSGFVIGVALARPLLLWRWRGA